MFVGLVSQLSLLSMFFFSIFFSLSFDYYALFQSLCSASS